MRENDGPPRLTTLLRWLPAAAWAALIFVASSQPGSSIPGRYSVVGHFAEYFVLATLVVFAQPTGDCRRRTIVALAVSILYGISDELHQAFVPMRQPDVWDVFVDAVGASCGVTTVIALRVHWRWIGPRRVISRGRHRDSGV